MIDIGALQAAHPEWNIVRAIAAPNGGIWALGRDGGVFSLNAQGGTDGQVAPYFGSYNEHPEWGAGTTARYFVDIQADPETGGYTLISNQPGQNYNFQGNQRLEQNVAPTAVPAPTAKTDFNEADQNALSALLRQHGLGDLVDSAWNYYKDPNGGAGNADAVLNWLPTTQPYRDHFPGLVEAGEQGNALTPAQWNIYYNDIQEAAVTAGLPPGMVDRADVGKMLVGGVSKVEAVGRIKAAGDSVYNADPAIIARMREFGFTDGDLTAFYLDPDKAEPLLARKAQEEQARISVAGSRGGYGIDVGEAVQLQKWGVDEAEAEQGFATLSDLHPLFANTAGESQIGEGITEAEQLGSTFGQDNAARQEIERRRKTRAASFQGGGGSAGGSSGKTGLG